MPIAGFSHQNVRTFYKGIKAFRADERRGELGAGQWSGPTQHAFALAGALTEAGRVGPEATVRAYAERLSALRPHARRWRVASLGAVERLGEGLAVDVVGDTEADDNTAAAAATALGVWAAVSGASEDKLHDLGIAALALTHRHPLALSAGLGHAFAVHHALAAVPGALGGASFVRAVAEATCRAEEVVGETTHRSSARLGALAEHLDLFPLDLQDLCDGTGPAAHESWPFAVAMFARNPDLVEASLLSAVNVGGDASGVGAMLGSLLGAYTGWAAFPEAWRGDLEDVARLTREADALAR
jgi:ADP-ribosylglycohydrolase